MAEGSALREQLERRLAALERRTRRIESDLGRPGDPDWTEQATQRENDEVLQGLGDAELQEMAQVRAALARLDDGSYGQCVRCGESIAPARLAVLPAADTCIDCAADATDRG